MYIQSVRLKFCIAKKNVSIHYFVNSHALRLCVVNVYIPAEELAPAEGVASSDTPCNKNRCINVTVILITILLLYRKVIDVVLYKI